MVISELLPVPSEFTERFPHIERLARERVLFWDRKLATLVGRAFDGVYVEFGGDPVAAERYFVDYPSPEQW